MPLFKKQREPIQGPNISRYSDHLTLSKDLNSVAQEPYTESAKSRVYKPILDHYVLVSGGDMCEWHHGDLAVRERI